jgi:hypothetical protein
MTEEIHVLNLGAGVQSTTLYLMFMQGVIPGVKLDYAIFADVGEEPVAVYRHLKWLQSLGGPPILIRSRGRLGEDLKNGVNSTGQRFASIPAYTLSPISNEPDEPHPDQHLLELNLEPDLIDDWDDPDVQDLKQSLGMEVGQTQRQCSREYKVEVIERTIRRELYGLEPGRRMPKDGAILYQYIGISIDEAGRAERLKKRRTLGNMRFPLIEHRLTRAACLRWLEQYGNVPHKVPRSACVFCPYHDDAEWLAVKAVPEDWARAVEIDEALRTKGNIVNRNMDAQMFVHRSCQPLVQIEFKPKEPSAQAAFGFQDDDFGKDCLGVCGL